MRHEHTTVSVTDSVIVNYRDTSATQPWPDFVPCDLLPPMGEILSKVTKHGWLLSPPKKEDMLSESPITKTPSLPPSLRTLRISILHAVRNRPSRPSTRAPIRKPCNPVCLSSAPGTAWHGHGRRRRGAPLPVVKTCSF